MHPDGDTAEAHQTDRPGQDFFDHGYKTPRDDGTTTDGRRVDLVAMRLFEINAGLTFFSKLAMEAFVVAACQSSEMHI
jgi:hypothetical protein